MIHVYMIDYIKPRSKQTNKLQRGKKRKIHIFIHVFLSTTIGPRKSRINHSIAPHRRKNKKKKNATTTKAQKPSWKIPATKANRAASTRIPRV